MTDQPTNETSSTDWESARRDKLRRVAELGHDPWGSRFDDHTPIGAIRARAGEIIYRLQDGREVALPNLETAGADFVEAKVAADILTNFPKELQIEVTLRLAVMDRVSPQVVQVVERGLKNKLSGVISDADFRATGGVDFLVKMLNQVDRGVQKTIFEALESTNPRLVDRIRSSMFTFDDLIKLDDRTIQRVLRDVSKDDLALCLKAAPEKLRDAIFRNLSERAREYLKEEIDILVLSSPRTSM